MSSPYSLVIWEDKDINMFIINIFMINMFINRIEELNIVTRLIKDRGPKLILIYGRRRVGKTWLALEVSRKNEKVIYLYTPESNDITEIIKYYRWTLKDTHGEGFIEKYLGKDHTWASFIESLHKLGMDNYTVIIDEFQRLSHAYKPSLTILQGEWDTKLSTTNLKLILMGSTVGVINRLVINGSAPLYGRCNAVMKLTPMRYKDARLFLDLPEEERIKIYSYLGGTPAYLANYNTSIDLWRNIQQMFIDKSAPYRDELGNILLMETRTVAPYLDILTQLGETGLPLSKIKAGRGTPTEYLRTLENLDIIEKAIPPTDLDKKRPKRMKYRIKDPLIIFLIKYIYPYRVYLEMGLSIIDKIKEDHNRYMGRMFERITCELTPLLIDDAIYAHGPWWWSETEIDCIALSKKKLYIIESKWGSINKKDLENLRTKVNIFMDIERWRGEIAPIIITRDKAGIEDEDIKIIDIKGIEEKLSKRSSPEP